MSEAGQSRLSSHDMNRTSQSHINIIHVYETLNTSLILSSCALQLVSRSNDISGKFSTQLGVCTALANSSFIIAISPCVL